MLPPMSDADPVDAAWAELESHWSDPDAHKRFVGLCAALGRLADAGARYRKVKDEDPTRADEASKRMAAVLTAATVALYESKSPAPKRLSKLNVFGFALAATLVLSALWAWLHAR